MLAEEKNFEIRRRLKQLEDKKRDDNCVRSEFKTLKKMMSDMQDQLTGVIASGSRGSDNTENSNKRKTSDDTQTKVPQRTSGKDQMSCKARDQPSSSQHSKPGRMTVGMFDQHICCINAKCFTIMLKMILVVQWL